MNCAKEEGSLLGVKNERKNLYQKEKKIYEIVWDDFRHTWKGL